MKRCKNCTIYGDDRKDFWRCDQDLSEGSSAGACSCALPRARGWIANYGWSRSQPDTGVPAESAGGRSRLAVGEPGSGNSCMGTASMSYPLILSVKTKSGYRLSVRWDDGSNSVHDLSSDVANKNWAAPLRNPRCFAKVRVAAHGHEVVWPGTDVELAADGLWYEAHPPAHPPPRWMSEIGRAHV